VNYSPGSLGDCTSLQDKYEETSTNKLPPWDTHITPCNKGLFAGVAPGKMSKCVTFCITKNGMVIPPWGTNIQHFEDGPWAGVAPGSMSSCDGFFITMNRRIFKSLQHSNELSKKSTDAAFRDVRIILTVKERAKKQTTTTICHEERAAGNIKGGTNAIPAIN